MWQPAAGGDPRMDEVFARLAALRTALREVNKHLEYLDALAWELQKVQEGDRKGH
jgi:hypothetical protein